MFSQTIFGNTPNCPNRTCGHPFYKESHCGFLPKSEREIYAIMRCPSCRDTFAIGQMMSTAFEYKKRLPNDPNLAKQRLNSRITIGEIREFQEKMESDVNPLKSLMSGPRAETQNYGLQED